jgi:perosamine synthetase
MESSSVAETGLDWFSPEFGGDEERLIIEVLRSGFINDGPATREFERKIADLVGVDHCVAVTSGTAAISLALMGVGIGAGDEVLVPDMTFIATANAVVMTGATVRLVDIEPQRLGIDVEKLSEAIGPRTRAVVTVDVNGRGADYRNIEALCRSRGLKLITDSAEGLGSTYYGQPLGSFGDAGCFSFSPNKLVTTGQGGIVATRNTGLYERLLELKDQGRRKRGTGGDDLHPVLGFNFKFTDLQAGVGLAQLERLAARSERARQRDEWYREELAGLAGVTFPGEGHHEGEVRVWTDALFDRRDVVRHALDAAGIGNRAFWYPLHTQGAYGHEGEFPVSKSISARGLWLPSTFDISREDVRNVSAVIRSALRSQGKPGC